MYNIGRLHSRYYRRRNELRFCNPKIGSCYDVFFLSARVENVEVRAKTTAPGVPAKISLVRVPQAASSSKLEFIDFGEFFKTYRTFQSSGRKGEKTVS